MLAAPRRSGAKPNADGTYALYTVSTYSFESTVKTKEIRLFDMQTRRSTLITNDEKASEPHWLENEVLYLQEGEEKGSTKLVVASIDRGAEPYTAAIVPGSISDLKLKTLEAGKVAVVCAAKTTHEDKLWNEANEVKRNHTGVVYDSTFVRHWDHYVDTTHYALWYGLFTRDSTHVTASKGRWTLSTLVNALQGTELESPIQPFPGTDHYDIGPNGLVFVAKDPDLNPAFHTKCNFYHVVVPDFTKSPPSKPSLTQAEGLAGAATGPVISPNGKMAVYMQMKEDGYEADRNRVLLVQDLASNGTPIELFQRKGSPVIWDRSPSKAVWSPSGQQLYFLAEEHGRVLLWIADLDTVALDKQPQKLTTEGHTTDVIPLPHESLFLNGDSLVDNSVWSLFSLSPREGPVPISSNTNFGAAFGLSRSQISEIWFKGAKGRAIHAWVVKPSTHAPDKKFPLAMAIHGGPQGAWDDSWSTRWNPAVFAEQGYVVVAPNPTGSTSYGQELTDAIQDNWGGDPYEDLVACFDYIQHNMGAEVDVDRAVALGASYGGYMINWIQGHDLGRKFKALICHDGVFSTSSDISQDEQVS
jgi:dipeptidyl aminopeptidase/acylaminoacyl peptidase